MYKELLVEVLGIVPVSHVGLITCRTVEVFHSLLSDDNPEMALEAILAHCISAARHNDHLGMKGSV